MRISKIFGLYSELYNLCKTRWVNIRMFRFNIKGVIKQQLGKIGKFPWLEIVVNIEENIIIFNML